MWNEQICGKDIAEQQMKILKIEAYLPNIELQEENTIMCECGEHKAKFKLIDEFKNKMNLCSECLNEMEKEYEEEKTSYEITKL